MPAVARNEYVFARLDELAPGPRIAQDSTGEGRRRLDVRRRLGITSFGVQAFQAPAGVDVVREHDEMQLGDPGQEELYVVLDGAATFEIDGEVVEAPEGALVRVPPAASRKATAGTDGATVLVVGGTPGKAYEPAPEEAVDALVAYNEGDYELAVAKQLVVVEKRPGNPVAHFNAGCFAALAGRPDEAIEHLRRAVAINERIGELVATDADLDSIRSDARFSELLR